MNTQIPEDTKYVIYCDGSCIGNPGQGGWGVVIFSEGKISELGGSDPHTTNNRMELMAAIQGLSSLAGVVENITVRSDSQYVVKGITSWIEG